MTLRSLSLSLSLSLSRARELLALTHERCTGLLYIYAVGRKREIRIYTSLPHSPFFNRFKAIENDFYAAHGINCLTKRMARTFGSTRSHGTIDTRNLRLAPARISLETSRPVLKQSPNLSLFHGYVPFHLYSTHTHASVNTNARATHRTNAIDDRDPRGGLVHLAVYLSAWHVCGSLIITLSLSRSPKG